LFAKGVVLGLSIAAPVGPMALLCLRTTLAHGFVPGLLGGLGVAAGDMFYAALAAFGLQAATTILTGQSLWLGVVGGLYLVWFGIGTMRQPLPTAAAVNGRRRGLATFVTTFLLTLANPPTIMIFAAMFASLGLAEAQAGTAASALAVVAGVGLGSAGWWVLFTVVVRRLRDRLRGPLFVWVNRVSGALLAGFGLWALARAATSFARAA
ncbi:MAG TPA: LysE family transporter, partial [Geminicoccaceae bacterium]|nr:LysE family transporter [Geminicoccaceae bacterium]